jgi:hypothetical protein
MVFRLGFFPRDERLVNLEAPVPNNIKESKHLPYAVSGFEV